MKVFVIIYNRNKLNFNDFINSYLDLIKKTHQNLLFFKT